MAARLLLDPSKVTEAVAAAQGAFHADVVRTVADAVAKDPVVVVGMTRAALIIKNPFVGKACKALEAAGIAYTYIEYGTYTSQWRQRLAIKMWSGWPTFPQVFVRGVLIGGATETIAAIDRGDVQRWIKDGTAVAGEAAGGKT